MSHGIPIWFVPICIILYDTCAFTQLFITVGAWCREGLDSS
jgi:hypothetical protein